MPLRLHYLPGTAAMAPHAALGEIGVAYELAQAEAHVELDRLDGDLAGRRWGRHLDPAAWDRPHIRAHFLRTLELPGVSRMIDEQGLELPPFAA